MLFAPPLMMPRGDWGLTLNLDYASSIELYSQGQRAMTLDAELARVQVWLTRRIDERWFVFGQFQIQGAYPGFMDSFIDWYHSLLGVRYAARELRPPNKFDYDVLYGKGQNLRYRPVDLGDRRHPARRGLDARSARPAALRARGSHLDRARLRRGHAPDRLHPHRARPRPRAGSP